MTTGCREASQELAFGVWPSSLRPYQSGVEAFPEGQEAEGPDRSWQRWQIDSGDPEALLKLGDNAIKLFSFVTEAAVE